MTGKPGWISGGGGRYQFAPEIVARVPAGMYMLKRNYSTGQIDLAWNDLQVDNLLDLPGLPLGLLVGQIDTFWNNAEKYKRVGFLHKRGFFLWGSPGCGKTCIVHSICKDVIAKDGVVIKITDFEMAVESTAQFRNAEPGRPLVTVAEDLDTILEGENGARQESYSTSLYDGQNQVNNVVHLATTNRPDRVLDKFIKRPGRFDMVVGIFPPDEQTREAYVRVIGGKYLDDDKVKIIVSKTEGLGLSYLRDVIASHLCLNIPLDDTLDRLQLHFKDKFKTRAGVVKTGYRLGFNAEDMPMENEKRPKKERQQGQQEKEENTPSLVQEDAGS